MTWFVAANVHPGGSALVAGPAGHECSRSAHHRVGRCAVQSLGPDYFQDEVKSEKEIKGFGSKSNHSSKCLTLYLIIFPFKKKVCSLQSLQLEILVQTTAIQ